MTEPAKKSTDKKEHQQSAADRFKDQTEANQASRNHMGKAISAEDVKKEEDASSKERDAARKGAEKELKTQPADASSAASRSSSPSTSSNR